MLKDWATDHLRMDTDRRFKQDRRKDWPHESERWALDAMRDRGKRIDAQAHYGAVLAEIRRTVIPSRRCKS